MTESMSSNTAKAKAKERDDYRCRFCGTTQEQHKEEYGRGLHAHHIIKDNDGGIDSPRNLITVCRSCHNTLEKTQADALSRIKEKHTERIRADFEDRIQQLEASLEEQRRETEEVYSWFEERSVRVHILLKGVYDPKIELYDDREKASESYASFDGPAKMITKSVSFGDRAAEVLRFASVANVDLHMNPHAGDYFESGESPTSGYRRNDLPEELQR